MTAAATVAALEALPCLNDRHLLGEGRRLTRMKVGGWRTWLARASKHDVRCGAELTKW
jgi:hypothetical protein